MCCFLLRADGEQMGMLIELSDIISPRSLMNTPAVNRLHIDRSMYHRSAYFETNFSLPSLHHPSSKSVGW